MVSVTTPIDQGDIYWVDPGVTSGSEQRGRRPYVIVSRDSINRGPIVVGVPLSTQLHKAVGSNIAIPAREIIADPGQTPQDSVALSSQVRVLDKTKLQKRHGRLTQAAAVSVGLGLKYVLDL